MMKLADYFTERDMAMCSLAKQVGVDYGVVRLPERKDFDLTDAAHWASYLDGFMRQGIRPWVIEPLPNSLYDMVKCGLPGAEEATEKIKAILALMGRFHLPVLCLNFMAHIGWLRTSRCVVAPWAPPFVWRISYRKMIFPSAPNNSGITCPNSFMKLFLLQKSMTFAWHCTPTIPLCLPLVGSVVS